MTSPFLNVVQDYALILGGSSKACDYFGSYFNKYSNNTIKCIRLKTKDCHKYGYKQFSDDFKNKNMRIVAICCLVDSLIPFNDAMLKLWNLPHNDITTSEQRRNKALMHKTISNTKKFNLKKMKNYILNNIIHKNNDNINSTNDDNKTDIDNNSNNNENVRFGKFFEISNYLTNKEEFENNLKKNNLSYPIVIKPPTSGGTDGVRLCYTFKSAQIVIKKHLFKINGENNKNITMMCQEFLDGEEYVINSVTHNSIHKFTDIWRAYKTFIVDKTKLKDDDDDTKLDDKYYPYSMLYDYQEFVVDVNTTKIKLIINYVCSVLDILGVKYGSSHTEVIYLPKENKVCLVELNARCAGGLPRSNDIVGYDQYQILALALCNSNKFINDIPKIYQFKPKIKTDIDDNKDNDISTIRAIFFQSKVKGKINFNKLMELEQLGTFKNFARELYYAGPSLWLKYQLLLTMTKSKLKQITLIEQQKYAQLDFNGGYIDNDELDILDQQKEECNHNIKEYKRIIGRIEDIELTVDLISSPGTIVLKGKICDIKNDYNKIRELEKDTQNGLFVSNINNTFVNQTHVQNNNNMDDNFMFKVYQLMEASDCSIEEAMTALQLSLIDN